MSRIRMKYSSLRGLFWLLLKVFRIMSRLAKTLIPGPAKKYFLEEGFERSSLDKYPAHLKCNLLSFRQLMT